VPGGKWCAFELLALIMEVVAEIRTLEICIHAFLGYRPSLAIKKPSLGWVFIFH